MDGDGALRVAVLLQQRGQPGERVRHPRMAVREALAGDHQGLPLERDRLVEAPLLGEHRRQVVERQGHQLVLLSQALAPELERLAEERLGLHGPVE